MRKIHYNKAVASITVLSIIVMLTAGTMIGVIATPFIYADLKAELKKCTSNSIETNKNIERLKSGTAEKR